MGRKRSGAVMLPDGVQKVVKPSGRVYYYFAPKRGTASAGPRVALGSDTGDPEFWRKLREAMTPAECKQGTLSALIADFKSIRLSELRPETRRNYLHFLDRLEASGGDRPVNAMTRRDIYQLLDRMRETPSSANFMLSVLRTLLEFGVPRGYRDDNPAVGVKRIEIEDRGHKPWPEAVYAFVIRHAPTHLRRMAFLGRVTGQRASDLVKMRGADLLDDGINVRITKLRDKPHFVPLTAAQMREIRSWDVRELGLFITTPVAGKRLSARYLNRLWMTWRESDEAAPIREMPASIHGLRATKIHDLRCSGAEDGAIADEIGMSVEMVSRYLRFADKTASARASRDRREQRVAGFENSKG